MTLVKDEPKVNPDEVVAYGATKLAHNLQVKTKEDIVINDVNPLTLGTDVRVMEELTLRSFLK